MAVLASTNVLRISEAITIRRKGKGVMEFYGVKNRVGWHEQPVGPWAAQWLEFIHMGRQRHTGRTEYSGNFGSVEELEASFKLLVAPTTWPELRWHSLRRLGAAQERHCGMTEHVLCCWNTCQMWSTRWYYMPYFLNQAVA